MSDLFKGFDEQWGSVQEAERGVSGDWIPPGTYKTVCVAVNVGKETEEIVDKLIIDNSQAGKASGVKIFLEILDPAEVPHPKKPGEKVQTKGKIIEHVFWVTEKTLPQIKRDAKIILGKPLDKVSDLAKIPLAGKTVEVGIRDEEYKGFVNSRIFYFNEWKPEAKGAPATAPGNGSGTNTVAKPQQSSASAKLEF